ncbi:GNAT family N-acetyltransferase [Erythrobacter sp. YT30]|uniref:GNAT family N-acetyltransferase n=1 Tax=Erythrobacter sp. YT30 TaxID=1735012 RepID=UPI0009EC134B|nr:N-acetyltransferase [Erythrobacter sp. YT30]
MTAPEIAITLRPERAGDEETIFALTEAAFRDMLFSDGDEQHLVNQLREDGDLTLSLVAEDAERIVGHIAISPVRISGGPPENDRDNWYGLGPVSVWPDLQGQGIGSALINRAIADMRARGAKGIILLGSPEYYSRFGFKHEPQLAYPGPPAEYFQALLLDGCLPSGVVTYAPAFG